MLYIIVLIRCLKSAGYESTVDKIVTASAEGGLVGDKEIDEFCYFFRLPGFATCVKGVFVFPIVFDGLAFDLGEFIEKVIHERGVDSSGAYGVDAYVFWPKAD